MLYIWSCCEFCLDPQDEAESSLRNIRGFENTLILAAQISPSFPAGMLPPRLPASTPIPPLSLFPPPHLVFSPLVPYVMSRELKADDQASSSPCSARTP